MSPRVVRLGPNQPPDRFYAGGERIAAFRRSGPAAPHTPEDWVGSTTTLFGEASLGLTRLPDGDLLAEAVRHDPVAWFGPDHVAAFGDDASLLVKLLDAGERLPVHVHPDVPFARTHLGYAHGKTEAWVALEPADVHLAFARDVDADEVAGWVYAQDADAMLAAMHTLTLAAGDAVLVPAGLPHAIGAGAFLVELQEPTDLSILLEWTGFDIDGRSAGHLGLGFGTALGAVDRRGWSGTDVEALRGATAGTIGDLLPDAAGFFRAERWRGDTVWDAGFAVVVVTAGTGVLVDGEGGEWSVRAGQTLLVPFAAGRCRVEAADRLELVRCRPPAPPA